MLSIEISGQAIFRDHHAYTESDIRELLRLREQKECRWIRNNRKDLINLSRNSAEC